MVQGTLDMTPRLSNWPAYTACLWAFVFAAMSFYWTLGGGVGMNTQSEQILAL